MSASSIIQSRESLVLPSLEAVPRDDIEAAASDFHIPPALIDIWTSCGYGFFSSDAEGNRLTSSTNRLVHPNELEEIKSTPTTLYADPFACGVPFFETLDLNYLTMKPDGSIVYCPFQASPILISESAEVFFESLMANPDFYETPINTGIAALDRT